MVRDFRQREKVTADNRPYDPGVDTAASRLMKCRDTEILLEGPAGTGKTRALLEKIFLICNKYPNARTLITRKSRESMTETVLVTLESKVIPVNHPCLEGASRKMRQAYHFPNGASIVVGGLDKPEKVMSAEYDVIGCFESTELFEDDHEKLLTRLRNGVLPYQQIISDCNPGFPKHWLNQRASQGGMTRLLSRHEDNPTMYRNGAWTEFGLQYLEKLDRLTGHRKERLRYGKWVAADGLVYEDFDARVHVVDRFEIPREWRKIVVIDFGYTNPFVAQWWAIDADGRMYLYREIYRTKRIVKDHAAQIRELSAGEHIEAYIADHDAEDRATLESEGIRTIAATKDVTVGIQKVTDRLRVQPDGKPRLFVFRQALVEIDPELKESGKLVCTMDEFDMYVWHKSRDGHRDKEQPVKENDHGMDAMRYATMYLDKPVAKVLDVPRIPRTYRTERIGRNW